MHRVILAALLAVQCSVQGAALREAEGRPLPREASRAMLVATPTGPAFLVATRTPVPLPRPVQGQRTVSQLSLRLSKSASGRSWAFAPPLEFTHWAALAPRGKKTLLVGTDIQGSGPFERPDNPMPRLWLVPVAFGAAAPRAEPTLDEVRQAHRRCRAAAKSAPLLLAGRYLGSIGHVSVAQRPTGGAVCVGTTPAKGLWAKGFRVRPPQWERDGGFLRGQFSAVSAAFLGDTLAIAAVDTDGKASLLVAPSALELAKATNQPINISAHSPKHTAAKEICLFVDRREAVLGIIPRTPVGQEVALLYRLLGPARAPAFAAQLRLPRAASSLSLLMHGKRLYYACIAKDDRGRKTLHLNSIPWPPAP